MFSSSIHHFIIWSDKCCLLVHITVEIHLFGNLEDSRWFHQLPPHPLLDLMMSSCFGTCSHSSFPENLTWSSRQFVLHLFFSGIPSLRYPNTNQIWIPVRYDGWSTFLGVITLVLIWLGKVMSCLAHLAGGPSVIVSFFNKVNHSSMRKLNDLFNKFFLMDPLCIQGLIFAWRPCQCYLEACLWYSDLW